MNESDLLFGLQEIDGIGWKTIAQLKQLSIPFTDLLHMKESDFISYGVHPKKAQLIAQNLSLDFILSRKNEYEKKQVGFLAIGDEGYPELLREISQPPWILYYRGNPELLQKLSIAVVGTRNPTHYGKKMAERISRQLSDGGFCIVSGLARGIDGVSHIAALEGAGGTIGVTAGGLDQFYPKEHIPLFHRLFEEGLVVSEFPLGTMIRKSLFPLRNRIIAGLSLGTVVVEGGKGSGSLITAKFALDESRDVFAVPGPVTSPKSIGALTLIKDGAKIVISVNDIFEEYLHMITLNNVHNGKKADSDYNLTEDERKIYNMITFEPVLFDTLLQASGTDFGHLHSVLLSLLLKNKIEQLPGSKYVRTD